jgi:hypothetical protein
MRLALSKTRVRRPSIEALKRLPAIQRTKSLQQQHPSQRSASDGPPQQLVPLQPHEQLHLCRMTCSPLPTARDSCSLFQASFATPRSWRIRQHKNHSNSVSYSALPRFHTKHQARRSCRLAERTKKQKDITHKEQPSPAHTCRLPSLTSPGWSCNTTAARSCYQSPQSTLEKRRIQHERIGKSRS